MDNANGHAHLCLSASSTYFPSSGYGFLSPSSSLSVWSASDASSGPLCIVQSCVACRHRHCHALTLLSSVSRTLGLDAFGASSPSHRPARGARRRYHLQNLTWFRMRFERGEVGVLSAEGINGGKTREAVSVSGRNNPPNLEAYSIVSPYSSRLSRCDRQATTTHCRRRISSQGPAEYELARYKQEIRRYIILSSIHTKSTNTKEAQKPNRTEDEITSHRRERPWEL